MLVVVALLFGRRAAAPIILPGICSESNKGNIGRRAVASEDLAKIFSNFEKNPLLIKYKIASRL